MALKGSRTEENLKEAFCRREPGQPPLPLFRPEGRRRRLQRRVGRLPLDCRRRDRTCPRPPRIPRGGRRSGHRQADRRHHDNLQPPLPARPTNTPTCTRAWPAPPARRASTRSPTGSRPWPRPRSPMPAGSSGPRFARQARRGVIGASRRSAAGAEPRLSRPSDPSASATRPDSGDHSETPPRSSTRRQPRCAVAASDRVARRRLLPTGRRPRRRCGASSTSVMAAGAASICATPSRGCST